MRWSAGKQSVVRVLSESGSPRMFFWKKLNELPSLRNGNETYESKETQAEKVRIRATLQV